MLIFMRMDITQTSWHFCIILISKTKPIKFLHEMMSQGSPGIHTCITRGVLRPHIQLSRTVDGLWTSRERV